MPSEGGVITPISNTLMLPAYGVDWGEDGVVVYGRGAQGIWRLPVEGGEPEPITTFTLHPDENLHMWPQSLAGGSLLLFSAIGTRAIPVRARRAKRSLFLVVAPCRLRRLGTLGDSRTSATPH